jgi:hypothetical protein
MSKVIPQVIPKARGSLSFELDDQIIVERERIADSEST